MADKKPAGQPAAPAVQSPAPAEQSAAAAERSASRIPGLGLLGRKVGMTRIFNDDGASVPVTVLEVGNNRVTQIKTVETDGYAAVQLAHGVRKASRIAKPQAGHFAKAGVEGGSALREFRLDTSKAGGELKVGTALGVDQFEVGQKVDVTGVTIGKGFSGAIKRHHFSSNRASHGNSVSHNAPGSIGITRPGSWASGWQAIWVTTGAPPTTW